jgi:hypothetical protein
MLAKDGGPHIIRPASSDPAAREQVVLCNIVTAATVGLGVAALYLALFVAMIAAALLLPGSLLGLVLGHPAGVADQVSLAWLATSIATLSGALGAALRPRRVAREDTNTLPVLGVASRLAPGRGWSHHAPGSARTGLNCEPRCLCSSGSRRPRIVLTSGDSWRQHLLPWRSGLRGSRWRVTPAPSPGRDMPGIRD